MPPSPKRHSSVIIFDVNCQNQLEFTKALQKLVFLKWSEKSKDETKIILLNSGTTKNKYDFEGVNEVSGNMYFPEPSTLLHYISNLETAPGNWLESLVVGLDYLIENCDKPGILTLQLVLMSDFSTEIENKEYVSKIIKNIKNHDIYLYIMGPPIRPNLMIKSQSDIQKWMRTIDFPNNNPNYPIIHKILSQTENSVVSDLQLGIHLFKTYKNPHETQPWLVPLSFCNSLKIRSSTVRLLNRGKGDPKFRQKNRTFKKFVNADDANEVFEYSDIIKCVKRHDKLVMIRDESRFKVEGDRGFTLIGFTDEEHVPEYLMRGDGSYCVKPVLNVMNYLIKIAKEEKKYGIVRRVYNKNNCPKYYVLIPTIYEDGKTCFIMSMLPYAEDIKYSYKETPLKTVPAVEVDKDTEDFLDSIDVDNRNCIVKKTIMPTMMFSRIRTEFANLVLNKTSELNLEFESLDVPLSNEVDVTKLPLFQNWERREIKSEQS